MTPFSYAKPTTLDDAVAAMAGATPDRKLLAGGQSLLLALKNRQARPEAIVSVGALPELRGVRRDADGALCIGAATTYAALAQADLTGWEAEVAHVAGNLADRSVRNIGTIGGGVVQADPRYDMPVFLATANAIFNTASATGRRDLDHGGFFNADGGTHLRPDEILVSITLPKPDALTHLVYEKYRYRTFEAAVGSAAIAALLEGDVVRDIRIGVGCVTKAPAVAKRAMAACIGKRVAEIDLDAVAVMASHEALPPEAAVTRQQQYQSELTVSLIKRAFQRLGKGPAA